MSKSSDRGIVRDALQAGYGDATQSILDDRVAGDVLDALREHGWASLTEIAAIILAAGGEVRISEMDYSRALDAANRGDLAVTAHEDYSTRERVLRVVRQDPGR